MVLRQKCYRSYHLAEAKRRSVGNENVIVCHHDFCD